MRNQCSHSGNHAIPWRFDPLSLAPAALILACALLYPARAQAQANTSRFLLGADISFLNTPPVSAPGVASDQQPASDVVWQPLSMYQEDGKPSNELAILRRHGWNAFRVRVFVSPVRNAPDDVLENAIPLARKIKDSGAVLILDLHFSDTWADPQHQEIPVAWRGMNIQALARQWNSYACYVVKAMKEAGAMPDIVQIGNEITVGTAWPLAQLQLPASNPHTPPQSDDSAKQWKNLALLLKAGIRGVETGAGNTPPRIAIHIDQGGHWDNTKWFFDHLNAAHIHFDIIAESFYPPWGHGTLDDLWMNMQYCAQRYPGKQFLVMETGYTPSHSSNNNDMLWPVTSEGRLQFMVDLVNTVRKTPNGLGVVYWAPERDLWNSDGTPGQAVFTLDYLNVLTSHPASHVPIATEAKP
jgi:arabinogalactan endo-1,4-beta-galactosidase